MKSFIQLLAIVALFTCCFSLASAQQLTPQEHEFAVKQLQETRAKFVKAIEGVNEAQWSWKADSTRWSVAETAEHIVYGVKSLYSISLQRFSIQSQFQTIHVGIIS